MINSLFFKLLNIPFYFLSVFDPEFAKRQRNIIIADVHNRQGAFYSLYYF